MERGGSLIIKELCMATIDFSDGTMPSVLTDVSRDSIISIFNTIFGSEPKFDNEDNEEGLGDGVVGIISFMGDVVGELANVLAGDIVARMSKEDFKVTMSLPTIMRGNDVEPVLPRGLPLEKLHFTMQEGNFMLKVAGAKSGAQIGRKPGT